MRVTGLDHIVLLVADIERSLAFYAGALGMQPVRIEEWRRGEVGFPSVRVDAGTIIDLFQAETPTGETAGEPDPDAGGRNLDHLCLVIDPVDLDELAASGDVDVVRGPTSPFGARGTGRSLYVHDPDRNVVELRYYPS